MIMARKLKAQGGPLHGKTVIVHETQETFTHHADTDGHYKVNEKSVTWQPDTKPTATVEKPAPKTTRRPKAKAPTKPTETPASEQAETPTD
jgi:hypothetical protein